MNGSYARPVTMTRFDTSIIGGADRAIDETGEKLKEEFLTFLETYIKYFHFFSFREGNNAPQHHQAALPTSEMLTGSEPPPLTGDLPYYRQMLNEMRMEGLNTLYVDYRHLFRYNDVLASAISSSYYRFEPFLRQALVQFVTNHLPAYARVANTNQPREFWVSIYGISLVHRLRELTTQKVGHLLSISGTVTRTSEVRPELYSGTFACALCQTIVRNIEQQFRYTEPTICNNRACLNRTRWTLLPDLSTFVNWQRVRLQENSTEIPPGSMPRTIDVVVRNDQVERAKPGDKCIFTGSLIVVPDVGQMALPGTKMESTEGVGRSRQGPQEGVGGLKQLGVRELTYKLSFLACMVQPAHNQANSSIRMQQDDQVDGEEEEDPSIIFTAAELEDIHRMRNTPNLYQQLVESIAPSIYGHAEVKTGILLMLFGGVHKRTGEGINLRGDINVCIVGDPGTAKSQLLRYVVGFLPRSVYTSGKASSAAGLTASVLKDEETGEFTIEAGALMLADNGICAIDEFDKMDIVDQVAIHEAMEQQTISISKAGIQATLNARTSILAAANPIGGRYDRRKTLRQNIAMTAPIMSRFDLFFVILDEGDERTDYRIARHLLSIHRMREQAVNPPFTPEQLARYIRYARCIKPQLTAEACELLVSQYKSLRQNDVTGTGSSYRMTVRQLESMVRLSEAMARLNCDSEVRPQYVRDACRLLKSSIIRVETENIDLETTEREWRQTLEEQQQPTQEVAEPNAQPPTKLSMRYEDYVRISNMLVYQIRHVEQQQQQAEAEGEEQAEASGMTKGALIDWFLERIEEELTTEAIYLQRRREVSAVIERLVHKDGVLIELRGEEAEEENVMVVVHPNYTIA